MRVLCWCCDLILAVGAADGRGDRRLECIWCSLPQVGECVCLREVLSSLSLSRQTAGQTGLGEQWTV